MVYRRAVLLTFVLCLFLCSPLFAITRTWTGAVSANWSVPGNWSPSGTPSSSDSLVFSGGASHLSMTNDLPPGTSVGPMTFTVLGYTLSGNALTLMGDATEAIVGAWQCNVDLKLGQSLLLRANGFSGAIDVNGYTLTVFSTPSSFIGSLNGSGAVVIDGEAASFAGGSFVGTITGNMKVSGSMPNADVAGGSLAGSGAVGAVRIDPSPNSDQTLERQLAPQTAAGTAATLETKSLIVNGALLSWGYPSSGQSDTVKVTGTVTLAGDLGFATKGVPLPGQVFTIIDNDGTDPVNGTFHQFGIGKPLPEGATFTTADGFSFTISYHGGDGNDVVVTAVTTSGKKIWTGAASALWSNPSNWSPPAIPAAGEDVVFPNGAAHLSMTNDLPPGTNVGAMNFVGLGYTLSGNALTLMGDATEDFVGAWQCNVDLKLGQSLQLRANGFSGAIDVNGYTLTIFSTPTSFTGSLNGSGAVVIEGDIASFAGGSFVGTITGSMKVSGAMPNADVAGGSLIGSGTVGAVRIDPSPNSDRTLERQLALQTAAGTAATLETKSLIVNGALLSWGYPSSGQSDIVKVTGTVTLAGDLGFATKGVPVPGQVYTIIDNDGTDPVNGTFSQFGIGKPLPEGETFTTADGFSFRISYHGGDGNDVVTIALNATTAALSQSAATTMFGEPVTTTATITPQSGSPTGSVMFTADGANIGTAPVQNGIASLTVSTLSPGTHSIVATFLGTGAFANSVSSGIAHVVNHGQTKTDIAANQPSVFYGQTAHFTVTVSVQAPAAGLPTGTVTVLAEGVSLGTAPVVNGTATFDTAALHAGVKSITASYSGDANFDGSAASAIQQSVSKARTAVDARPRTPVFVGESPFVTVFVNVTPSSALVPSGSVSVIEAGATLGTRSLIGGTASVSLNPLAVGDHTLVVDYGGDTDFEASSATITQSVVVPAISIQGAHVLEGNRGVTSVSLVATLSAASSQTVRVSFSTVAGSATEGEDYERASGVIVFAPGELTHAIELHIFGDTIPEDDETFSVLLSDPVNATIDTPSAAVVIVNDDQVPPRRRPSHH